MAVQAGSIAAVVMEWTNARSSIILSALDRSSVGVPSNQNVEKTAGGEMNMREDGIPWRASTRSIGSSATTIRNF